jgi:RNA polymerase sigma factor (sigma-70 family)
VTENHSLHNLIRMMGNGDPTAFNTLYTMMRQPLCNKLLWKYRSSLTKEDVEDIVQNTFVKVQLYASRYNGLHNDASAKNWMYKIANSEALKIINMNKRLSNTIDDHGDGYHSERNSAVPESNRHSSGSIQEGRHSVEEQVERSLTLKEVDTYVKNLPPQEQWMLARRFDDQCTFEQIGDEIGRTKPRAKQIIDGLVGKIRKSMGLDFPDQ